jgi:hypothetical protein
MKPLVCVFSMVVVCVVVVALPVGDQKVEEQPASVEAAGVQVTPRDSDEMMDDIGGKHAAGNGGGKWTERRYSECSNVRPRK